MGFKVKKQEASILVSFLIFLGKTHLFHVALMVGKFISPADITVAVIVTMLIPRKTFLVVDSFVAVLTSVYVGTERVTFCGH